MGRETDAVTYAAVLDLGLAHPLLRRHDAGVLRALDVLVQLREADGIPRALPGHRVAGLDAARHALERRRGLGLQCRRRGGRRGRHEARGRRDERQARNYSGHLFSTCAGRARDVRVRLCLCVLCAPSEATQRRQSALPRIRRRPSCRTEAQHRDPWCARGPCRSARMARSHRALWLAPAPRTAPPLPTPSTSRQCLALFRERATASLGCTRHGRSAHGSKTPSDA